MIERPHYPANWPPRWVIFAVLVIGVLSIYMVVQAIEVLL